MAAGDHVVLVADVAALKSVEEGRLLDRYQAQLPELGYLRV